MDFIIKKTAKKRSSLPFITSESISLSYEILYQLEPKLSAEANAVGVAFAL